MGLRYFFKQLLLPPGGLLLLLLLGALTAAAQYLLSFAYRAADAALVTSLHDGMNLVCKEFVAARDDERGVLILSRFAGAGTTHAGLDGGGEDLLAQRGGGDHRAAPDHLSHRRADNVQCDAA